MEYQIQRGHQKFGPYSLAELQQYVQEGRVLLTDLAQSEGMSDWVPVSQILGNIPIPAPAQVLAPPAQNLIPLPPNLHWALLLVIMAVVWLLGVVRALFIWGWAIMIANWARRLVNDNKVMVLVAMYPAGVFAGIVAIAVGAEMHNTVFAVLGFIFIAAGWLAYIFGIFKIRDAMEDYYNSRENIALSMSGVMTFFFSLIYIQYHINRIHKWKQTGILT